MADAPPEPAPPIVPERAVEQLTDRIHVLRDLRIEFVPNAGIVVGDRAALVIDTAMGRANGERILRTARELAGDRPLILTTTHFHPEHAFGAEAFEGEAVYVANRAQVDELADKGAEYVEMFAGFGPALAELLDGVRLLPPQIVFDGGCDLDLGGITARLRDHPAHTRGDQVIFLPEAGVLFAGDLVEERFLPIFPDADARGPAWLDVLDRLDTLGADVVVPGHGAVGDRGLIAELRTYLETVRDAVAAHDGPVEELVASVEQQLAERYASWDNQMWIASAIESFHRERG